MKVVVIIPAAGLGTRMTFGASAKGRKPGASKQFTELGGTPILMHALRRFAASPEIAEIYVALRKNEISSFRTLLEKEAGAVELRSTRTAEGGRLHMNRGPVDVLPKRVQLVEGGEHRQQSVASAMAAVSASPDDIVLVHDAVRPFVTEEIIQNVIRGAQKYGAAIAGLPAVDTVKQVERTAEGAVITATVPRERVVMAQTPQGFRYAVIKNAFAEATADGFLGTDEASLVERSGYQVAVVMGSPRNIKITTPEDLELAEFYLKAASPSAVSRR
jgi:2-C-methyl-D-erythritol 4-phosphate cytidylyltransferase